MTNDKLIGILSLGFGIFLKGGEKMAGEIGAAAGTGPMRCPKCGAVTWGNLKFCSECGENLNITCPGCGATWRYYYYYAYCPECGAKTGQKFIESLHGRSKRY